MHRMLRGPKTLCIAALAVIAVFFNANSIKEIYREHASTRYHAWTYKEIITNTINSSPAKRIILWNTVYGSNDQAVSFSTGPFESDLYCSNNNRCTLSRNKENPLEGDALMFHMCDWHSIPSRRLPNQAYIMYGWESPAYRRNRFVKGGDFYNLTATYSRWSDIRFSFGRWFNLPVKALDALKNLPQFKKRARRNGTAIVAWIVSNCRGKSHRKQFVSKLKQYIAVDIYGRCGKTCPQGTWGDGIDCFQQLARRGQYKFYLALENSLCQDYISEKPYRALNCSMVPVVFGGTSPGDYAGLLPPNAYIDVRNFTDARQLAEYLHYLDNNDDKYLDYHAWRTDYWVQPGVSDSFCQICDFVHSANFTKIHKKVNWGVFWNVRTRCQKSSLAITW